MKKKFKMEKIVPYLFIAPTMIGLLVFAYWAIGYSVVISFTDKQVGFETHWVGIDNYIKLFQHEMFTRAFKNQILVVIARVFNAIFWPTLAAELVFFIKHKWITNLVKRLFVIPMLVPGIVTTNIWKYLYNNAFGINNILRAVGLDALAKDWLNDPEVAMIAVLLVGFPFIAGLNFLIMHTAVNMVGEEFYEAAIIDGATSLQVVRYIHIPNLVGYAKTVGTLALIGALGEYAGVAALTGGGPGFATTMPALVLYNSAFGDGKFGYASAMGVILMIEVFVITIATRAMVKEEK